LKGVSLLKGGGGEGKERSALEWAMVRKVALHRTGRR